MSDEPEAQITMSRIPIRGGVGAFALIVILVSGVAAELPQLRGRFLAGVALGLLVALALILWRRRTMDANTLPPGAHTMFAPEPAASASNSASTSARDAGNRAVDETRGRLPISRPGAHPRVVPAS
jgi:hypothetical protein